MTHKINTVADLLKEYPGISQAPRLDALLLAYKLGRLEGHIETLEEQAITKAKREAEDALMDEACRGNA